MYSAANYQLATSANMLLKLLILLCLLVQIRITHLAIDPHGSLNLLSVVQWNWTRF